MSHGKRIDIYVMVRFKDGNLKALPHLRSDYFWEDLSTDIFEEDYFEYTSYRDSGMPCMDHFYSFDEVGTWYMSLY